MLFRTLEQRMSPSAADDIHRWDKFRWAVDTDDYPHQSLVKELSNLINLQGVAVVEPGCFEGYCSVGLAELGATVTAFDARPHNLVKAFLRAVYHGVQDKITFLVSDADALETADIDAFDILWHCGLLYHLIAPVKHLQAVLHRFQWTVLETHIAHRNRNPRFGDTERHDGYLGRPYREFGWADELSGLSPWSFWLQEDELLRLFDDMNMTVVRAFTNDKAANGPRRSYILKRPF